MGIVCFHLPTYKVQEVEYDLCLSVQFPLFELDCVAGRKARKSKKHLHILAESDLKTNNFSK